MHNNKFSFRLYLGNADEKLANSELLLLKISDCTSRMQQPERQKQTKKKQKKVIIKYGQRNGRKTSIRHV